MKNIITTKFSAVVVSVLLLTSFAVFFPSITLESFTAAADEVTIMSPDPFLSFTADDALVESIISKIGGTIMIRLADNHDIDVVMGKNLTQGVVPTCGEDGTETVGILAADNPVDTRDCFSEFNPSIAAKPNSPNILVAVAEVLDLSTVKTTPDDISGETVCRAYVSTDGGESWTDGIPLPLPAGIDDCAQPAVRWAPADGTDPDKNIRLYAAYVGIEEEADEGDLSTSRILVSFSNNDGLTWSPPTTVFSGMSTPTEQHMLFQPWIGTHLNFPGAPGTGVVNDKVYVTATRVNVTEVTAEPEVIECTMDILFNRSINGGAAFIDPQELDTETSAECDPALGGPEPAGGKPARSEVLVCWYHSGEDGFLEETFDIKCRRSGNYGDTFVPTERFPVDDREAELPFAECPETTGFGVFQLDWWKGMFPSLEITRNGVAHIVYAADDNEDADLTAECGNIFYTRSNKPYNKWTPLVLQTRLNDDPDGKAQSFPTITSKTVIGKIDAILVAAWVDTRHSQDVSCTVPDSAVDEDTEPDEYEQNCTYDIFYAYTDASWSDHANRRVTDVSSLSGILQVQEYMDSSAHKVLTTPGNAFLIWTDRSDQGDTANEDEDVYEDVVNLPP